MGTRGEVRPILTSPFFGMRRSRYEKLRLGREQFVGMPSELAFELEEVGNYR